jgi:hypothetical protein
MEIGTQNYAAIFPGVRTEPPEVSLTSRITVLKIVAAIAFSLLATEVLSQEANAPDVLFQSSETLTATITAPLDTLARDRPKEDYLPGTFEYTEADGTPVKFDIEIRTRGHFRHKNCKYPPLRLNFKKGEAKGTLFDKQDKLKLVVHCGSSSRYEQVVLREYLVYRLLNVFTENSFRVRLLHITYIDSDERRSEQTRYAFLIEHDDRFAKRLELKRLAIQKTKVASIQPDFLNLTSVFEFFIANTDFSPIDGPTAGGCCHNYVLLGNDTDEQIAIPYDFDQSGFVNAPYATPNSRFNLRSVKSRLYRGRCM